MRYHLSLTRECRRSGSLSLGALLEKLESIPEVQIIDRSSPCVRVLSIEYPGNITDLSDKIGLERNMYLLEPSSDHKTIQK